MNKQKALPMAALALLVVGGAVMGISKISLPVQAQSNTPVSQQQTTPDKEVANDNKQTPAYTSSIRVPESKQEMDDGTEAKQLASLAKISSDQAKAAAEKSAGGSASSVKLEEENGNVVYTVTVGTKEVKVDAGNGSVLLTETAETPETGESGSTETN